MLVTFNDKFCFHKLLANEIEKLCFTNTNRKSFVKYYNNEIIISKSKFDIKNHNHEVDFE